LNGKTILRYASRTVGTGRFSLRVASEMRGSSVSYRNW